MHQNVQGCEPLGGSVTIADLEFERQMHYSSVGQRVSLVKVRLRRSVRCEVVIL